MSTEQTRLMARIEQAEQAMSTVQAFPDEESLELINRIPTLFAKIAHGSQEHRDWLEKAITAHFLGEPSPEYKS